MSSGSRRFIVAEDQNPAMRLTVPHSGQLVKEMRSALAGAEVGVEEVDRGSKDLPSYGADNR